MVINRLYSDDNFTINVTSYNVDSSTSPYTAEIATKDRTILYFVPKVVDRWVINISFGEVLLNCFSAEGVAFDITNKLNLTEESQSITVSYRLDSSDVTVATIRLKFNKIIGYHYADYARLLATAPNEIEGNQFSIKYNAASGEFVAHSIPLNMYYPTYEDGTRLFGDRTIYLPMWFPYYGNNNLTTLAIKKDGSLVNNIQRLIGANSYVGLNFGSLEEAIALAWRIIGNRFMRTQLRPLSCKEKYIIVKYKCPYGAYFSTATGATKTMLGQFIFKVFGFKTDVKQQVYAKDVRYYPNRISSETVITCGIDNITTWDKKIYSQILLSEEIQVLYEEGTQFEPAELVPQDIEVSPELTSNNSFRFELKIAQNG